MTHSLIRIAVAGFLVTAATLATQSVEARTTPRKCTNTLVENVSLVDRRALMALEVHKNVVTTIELKGRITQVIIPKPMVNRFWFQQTGKDYQVFEFKPTTAPAKSITSITLKSKHETVHMLVYVAKNAMDTGCLLYRIVSRSPELIWKERLQPWCNKQLTEQHNRDVATLEAKHKKAWEAEQKERQREREESASKIQGLKAQAVLDQRAAVAQFFLQRRINTRPLPIELKSEADNPTVSVRVYEPAWNGGEYLVPFELHSPGHGGPAVVAEVQAVAEIGGTMSSELLVMESPVEVKQGYLATVSAGHPVRGVLSLPAMNRESIGAMRLVFQMLGSKPVVASLPKWYPLNVEQLNRERRRKQVSVNLRVLGGAFWTDDAVEGTEAIAGTSMLGVSVRYQKGYLNGFALEIEGAGARTEQARFRDVTWNGMQGEIARSASLFRFMAGGAARLGDRYVTTVRLGVGVQATSYDSRFSTGGATMDGPGGSFEIDGVWSFGASFDARLGKSWTLGLGATFAKGVGSKAQGLDAGLHLGYRWSP